MHFYLEACLENCCLYIKSMDVDSDFDKKIGVQLCWICQHVWTFTGGFCPYIYGQNPPIKVHIYGQNPPIQGHIYGQNPPIKVHIYGQNPQIQGHINGQNLPIKVHIYGPNPPINIHIYGQNPPIKVHIQAKSSNKCPYMGHYQKMEESVSLLIFSHPRPPPCCFSVNNT